jgi:5'-deoxynucleotidase YfbR-like HD superfamily hydrolase
MKSIARDVEEIIALSDLLGISGQILRATKLPDGQRESDSHHSFSLALIAYDVCHRHDLALDMEKILLYALVHDLLEIVTGDEDTLRMTTAQLEAKKARETAAVAVFEEKFSDYPRLSAALHEYERLDTPEAATIYVLDKACTMWTHFHDSGDNLRGRGVHTRADIAKWHRTQKDKMSARLMALPPPQILDVYEASYEKMVSELFHA